MNDNLTTWLGPAATELSSGQIAWVRRASRAIDARYPDPDEEGERQTALSATVQFVLGDTDAKLVAIELATARMREREAYVAAVQVAVLLVDSGMAEATAARECGIDRMSLRKALGKRD